MIKISWDKSAYISLQRIYEYIKTDSTVQANKVKEGILKSIRNLATHPEKYPPDKFRKGNRGNYRAFEKYSYRVTYKHTKAEIKILRIRHVK
jgi:plasmid stabilization system protein ParE